MWFSLIVGLYHHTNHYLERTIVNDTTTYGIHSTYILTEMLCLLNPCAITHHNGPWVRLGFCDSKSSPLTRPGPTIINKENLQHKLTYVHERFKCRCQSTVNYAKTQHNDLDPSRSLVLLTSSLVQYTHL